jgi:hypothetical protein
MNHFTQTPIRVSEHAKWTKIKKISDESLFYAENERDPVTNVHAYDIWRWFHCYEYLDTEKE